MRIDEKLTERCIENTLGRVRSPAPEERTAIAALIAATGPQCMAREPPGPARRLRLSLWPGSGAMVPSVMVVGPDEFIGHVLLLRR
jgi:hypothetical protein